MHTLARRNGSVLWPVTLSAFVALGGCGSSSSSGSSSSDGSGGAAGERGTETTASSSNGGTGGSGTNGTTAGPDGPCQLHQDCNDGSFCNGEERCDPDDAGADENGCIPGDNPCPTASCDESGESCVTCDEGDVDEDGHAALTCGGDDCDDNDPDRYPGNTEVCDAEGHDEDCDLETLGGPSDADKDDDNYDDRACCNELPDGELACGNDCDDDQAGVNPGSPEACNDIDDNCDEEVDVDEEGVTLKLNWYEDRDADGHGLTSSLVEACSPPETDTQWVNESGDCLDDPEDENSAGVNPGVAEACDDKQLDENCNGTVDENCPCLPTDEPRPCGPVDENGDMLLEPNGDPLVTGRCARGTQSCVDAHWAEECVGSVGPIPELCTDDDLGEDDDENCDGITDGDDTTDDLKETRFFDNDNDSYGVAGDTHFSCDAVGDYTAIVDGDCNDGNGMINPGQTEVCNDIDDNCDDILDGATVTNDQKQIFYRDQDDDLFGVSADSRLACSATGAYTTQEGGDCDDDNELVYPSQDEECNGIDDNCDDIVDGVEADNDMKRTYYRDQDLDTYGNENNTASYCTGEQPSGWVLPPDDETSLDCNDNNANINPEATETCNGVDQNCNGQNDTNDPAADASCEITGQIATPACQVNTCVVASCLGSYLDCDDAFDCEIDGSDDIDNCGACDNGCWFNCSSANCDEVEKLALGYNHSCIVTTGGRVACWGANDVHQVSSSNGNPIAEPELVDEVGDRAKAIAAGYNHTCAVVGDSNEVWCWGANSQGQLGHTPSASRNPSAVDDGDLTGATDLAGGGFHSCAVVAGGEVRCWGQRSSGQLGNNSTAATPLSSAAVVVLEDGTTHLSGVADVTAGEAHTCARTPSGGVYCWGDNSGGQLGTGGAASPNPMATPVAGLSGVDMLVAGSAHTCALVSGEVHCWGDNSFRQLGQASGSSYPTPTEIAGLTDAVTISAGSLHTCAVRAAGSVVCWGGNSSGERGEEPGDPSATRVTVSDLSASLLASSGFHNCAVRTNGAAVCWGDNSNGQLGNGETSSTHLIQLISPLE